MKHQKKPASSTDKRPQASLFILYYLSIAAVMAASLYPENRIWGLNQWAFLPQISFYLLVFTSILLPPVFSLLKKKRSRPVSLRVLSFFESKSAYFIFSSALVCTMGLCFFLLRAKTHFLGDGYLNLSSLASSNPLVKFSSYGTVHTLIWLKSLIDSSGDLSALLSFQIVSILSGVLFTIVTCILARKLFDNRYDSLLFALGLISGGYTLLFFGYVEYYSLFVLSVLVYTIIGLLIVKGRVNRWVIIPLFLLTNFFHAFGICLMPSTLFLLWHDSRPVVYFESRTRSAKWRAAAMASMLLIAAFFYLYMNSYGFRFSVVPIFPDRFTVEGYSLFSFKHIVDFFNLLLLLVPGLPVFLLLLPYLSKQSLKQRASMFLLIMTASTLAAVFLIDPKLGMPRDWDLFSFAGIPLAVLAYYTILSNRQIVKRHAAVTLVIMLGFFSLVPRAVRQNTPELAIAEFRNYAALDQTKNRTGRISLGDYYRDNGDSLKAEFEYRQFDKDFPENLVVFKVDSLDKADRGQEALEYARWAIKKNPAFATAYYALGTQYLEGQYTDSAIFYLEIATALNPQNAVIWDAMGFAFAKIGDMKKGEQALRNSINLDKKSIYPILDLLKLYATSNQERKYDSLLSMLAEYNDIRPEILARFGIIMIEKGEIESGLKSIEKAVTIGLDSVFIRQLEERYPQLKLKMDGAPEDSL
ncbi:MAG: hypothetical protein IIA17_09385 [candidate division Zixibacteria bacterium]|nr:hypothetical protein [candidate division Zixibacteria bacterium]